MRVAVVGAGPLGLFYAAQLRRQGASVTLVRRRGTPGTETWDLVSRTTGAPFTVELTVALELPSQLDVIVIAVRAEQLTSELVTRVVAAGARAVVCLTPALGTQLDAWRPTHPELVMAMPAVAVEVSGRSLGYWVAPSFWGAPSTLVEYRGPNSALLEFVSLLRRASLRVSWVSDARARTLANTVALFPVHVAIYLEPSFERWLDNHQLRTELGPAIARAHRLAVQVGRVDPALRLLAVWMSSAWRIRLAVWLLVRLAPSLSAFLEHHFGPKLAAQHAELQRDIEALALEQSLPTPLPPRWVDALAGGSEDRTEPSGNAAGSSAGSNS